MRRNTILCNRELTDGRVCGAEAIVRSAQHEYDTLMYQGAGGFQYRLRESLCQRTSSY
jgi:hypothetical protein